MKRGLILVGLLMGWMPILWAQPRLSFDKNECNMGEILWKKPVTVTYTVINTGNQPLVITNVDASCGCVNPVWPKKPIPPKGFGTVSATFDAKMLGHFQKQVGVYSNATEGPVYLTLKGVVRSEITDYSKLFPVQVGSIYLDKNHVEFPDVNRGDEPMAEIDLVNASDKEYTPVLMHLPSYIEARAVPEVLKPKQAGKIQLTLHSDALNDLGMTHTSVYLARFPGDKVSDENEIEVMAVLLPDFSGLTAAQRAVAPKAHLSADSLTMALGGKKKLSQTVVLTNTGKSALEIREMQVTDPALNVTLKKRSLKPGEAVKMKVTAVAKYLKRHKRLPRILMITNDPDCPKVELTVRIKK